MIHYIDNNRLKFCDGSSLNARPFPYKDPWPCFQWNQRGRIYELFRKVLWGVLVLIMMMKLGPGTKSATLLYKC